MDIHKSTEKMRFCLLLMSGLYLFNQSLICQTKARITDVDFILNDRYITVSYILTGSLPKEEMTIELKFISENNETIIPRSIMNDVGTKVYGDGQKAIVWDIISDQVVLSGNWKASVAIVSSRVLYSGAGNAILSMIFPGFGGYYVDTKKGRAVLTTLSALGLGIYGAYEKIQANKYFEDYESSSKPADIETLYTTANDHNHKYYMATRAAAGIMALDVVYVFFKGIHNRKVAKNAYNAFSGDGLTLRHVNNGVQIGYTLTF